MGTQREIAERFAVSLSFVRGLLRRFRQTGGIEPSPHGGGLATRITERDLEPIRELLAEDPRATLGELCERVASRESVRPSRAVRKLRDSRTPRPATHASEKRAPAPKAERQAAPSLRE